MKYLSIVETEILDTSWIKSYKANVPPILSKYGGRYITRSDDHELLEGGSLPHVTVVAEFPSKQHLLDFYHSEEYAPYRDARQKGAKSRLVMVPIQNDTF